ncbi:putative Ig domain-containing protein [Spirosoma rigui]|uniref:putative Ig domain-containing protein n=1 Tax=Spirosoma rigui TaxID=564064 RepID=UPI0012D2F8BD|nr:putative Ig domain-containing protein [Spirosoma rigui]
MHTFLSLLIGWIRQLHYFLFGPDLTAPVPSPVPIAQWHRALYQPRAVRDRLYLIGMALLSFMPFGARAQFVSLNVPIGTTPSSFTQNFNSLPSSGLLDIGITTAGLLGTGGNGIYSNQLLVRASTGAPDLLNLATGQYSFGSDATDRALGSNSNLTNTSSGVIPIRYGVLIRNTTGYPLSSLDVSYTGEQWYRDGDRAAQSLTFDYVRMGTTFNAVNALLLLTGDVATLGGNTYTPVSSLSFTSPNFVPGSATELDGNATANRDARKGTITFEDPLPVNAYILLRWTDVDDSEGFGDLLDTDHSLAIDDLSVTAAIINSAPTVVAGGITNPQTATVSSPFTLRASAGFTDLETPGSLTYAATGLPASLSINATTGVITGTPSTTVGSPYTVTVRVTDPLGLSVSSGFTLIVVPANIPPILTATPITTPQSATVGVAFSTTTAAAFSDPDGGILAYSATGLPSGVTISPTTGVISGSPTVSGAFSVTVTARDPANGSVSTSFALNVSPAPPAGISITGNTVLCAGQTLTLTALPVNIPGLVTISAAAPTGSVTVNGTSITVTGLPSGVSTLTVTASVASLSVVSVPVSVTVNDLPIFTSALSTTATPGSLLTLGSCSLGGTVSYTVLGGTSAGTTGSGSLSLTPELAGQSVRIACTGTACPSAATTLNLPSLSVALNVSVPSLVCEGQPLSLTLLPTGIDISNPLLAVGISGPANLTVSALSPSGVVTVQGLPAGSSTLTVSLSLSSSQIASVQVPVSVSPTPTQPTQPTTLTITVGSEFALSASALCPTGSLLTVGGLTGLSSILVPTVTAGTQSLTVLCTNGSCLSLPTVVNVNVVAPVLSAVVSPSVCVGTPLSLTLLPTTGIDPLAPGLTVTASTSSGSLTVGALTDGVVSLSGGNLTAGLNQPLSVSVNLGGITLASTTLSINVLDTPPTPTQPGTLTATVGNVLSLTGLCPTGTLVSLGSLTGSGSILVPTTTAGTQSLTVLCSNGTCVGLPTIVNVDVLAPVLSAVVSPSVCVGTPLSLTLLPSTGIDPLAPGLTVTASTSSGSLTVGALTDGVVSLSGGNLTAGLNQPLSVSVNLGGITLASTTLSINVLDTPPTPTQPGTLTATVGNVLSLTGLCPTGTLVSLGSLTGSGSILVPTTTAGTQSLTVLCSNGTCVGLPTIVNVDVLAPVLSAVVSPSVCVGTPLSLTLLPSTGIDPLAPGLTVTASTSSGSLTVGVLTNGVVSLSGGNLTAGLNQPLSVSVNLGGITLASTTLSINVLDTPPTPTQPGTLTATVGNVLSLTGLCPTGTLVSLGSLTGSGSILVPTTTAGTQSLTVLCSNGTCVGLPTIVNVDVLGTLTASVPTAVCVNQPFSLTVLPTGFDLTQTGIGVTVTTPSGALTVGALNNGVLTISSGALTVGPNQPLTVNVTLAGQTIASTTVNLNVLAQPAAPTPVAALTATVGSVLSLSASALCPTGSLLTLGSLDGSGSILVPTTTIGSQSLTVLCTNGTCLSLPTVIDVSVVAPVLSVSATAAICVGQPASLTILPTNFGINDGIVSLSITGPANINVSAINNDGVVTITGLPAGSQVLTITATVAGAQVATFQTPAIIVTSVAAPAIVSASGGTYPSGQTSLTVTQNTGNVLFNASCSSGTFSYTGSDNSNGTGGTITVPTTATGVFSYTGVCTSNSCVSEATVVSVTVVAPINNAPTIVGNGLISPQSATVGVGFTTETAYAFNDDGTLTYSVTGLPNGLDINATTGQITGTPTVAGSFTVLVTATDAANQSVSDDFVLNVVPVNNVPTIVGNGLISPQSATVGVGFTTETAYAFNDDGTLTYSVAGLPAGLDINGTTGVISGTPTVSGPFTVTVTVTDVANQSVSDDFVLNVSPAPVVNNPPTIVGNGLISPQSATVGVGFTTPTAYAFNDDGTLTYSVAGLPAGLDINGTTGVISGTPTVAGSFTVLVTATDAANQSVSDDFVLNVVPVNNAPTIVGNGLISPQSATVGVGFTTETAYAFNDDGTLTYSVTGLPNGLDINATTGQITGTPTVAGSFTVLVTATDAANQSVSDDFVLNVVPVNNVPTIVGNGLISPQSATVGVGFTTETAYAFNDDGTLTYSVAGLPAGLDINGTTGVISGTPTVSGPFTVTVTVTDVANQSVSDDFVLNVSPAPVVNNPPTIVGNGLISPQSATVGVGFTTPTAYAFNDDGTLTYSVAGLPAGLDINGTTGVISGTPTVAGSFTVLVTATDAANQSVSDDFVLNVVPVNNAPTIVGNGLISPQSATVGVGFTTETAYAFNDDGTLTYSVTGLPNGLDINATTGQITGTPTVAGSFTVLVTATDAANQSVSDDFVLNVVPVNNVPTIVGNGLISPQSATVGVGFTTETAYAFNDDGTLTYSVAGLPAGLDINGTTGVISGTPTVSGPFTVTVTVTDVANQSVSDDFVLNVSPAPVVNNPPTIVGNGLISPQSATVGVGFTTETAYAFNDDGTLTYSVAGLPAGLDINGTTGVISGTPTVSGPFTVTVTVTDVANQSVSDDFVLNVSPAPVVNNPPTIVGNGLISPQSATVGVGFTTPTAYAFNDDGTLTYSVAGLPAGLDINGTTGVISGTPTVSGPFTVTVTVTDVANQSVSDDFVLNVSPAPVVNNPPTIVGNGLISPQSATVGVGFTTETAYAFNDDGTLTYSVTGLPNGLDINATTGQITGTPTVAGSFTVLVTATDAANQSVSDDFVLNVVPVNNAPTIVGNGLISPQSATVGVGFTTETAYAFNDDGTLTYSVTGLPNGLDINATTGQITGTPTVAGSFTVLVTATDAANQSVSDDFILNVVPAPVVNNSPMIVGNGLESPKSGTVGVGLTIETAYAFTDDGALTYSATGLPNGVVINPTTGVISGAPSLSGTFGIIVTATDVANQSISDDFTLNVVNPTAPVSCGSSNLDGSPLRATMPLYDCAQITTTGAIQFTGAGGNSSGGVIEFSAIGITDWTSNCNVVIDREARTACDAPAIEIRIRQLVNGQYVYGTPFVFNIRQACPVQGCGNTPPTNQSPIVSGSIPSPQTATVGANYSTPTANAFTDPDGGMLTYSAGPLPNGITINPTTGVISGVASTTVGSPFTVIVTATDPQNASATTSYVLNVVNPAPGNQSPMLTGTPIPSPQTATVGSSYSTPTASAFTDPDGGPLTYSAGPLPNGITINPTTGVISGVASTTAGSPFTVVVTATDPQNASVSTNFVLNVVNPTAPVSCGSSNLDGSPLRATMPLYDCAQITTTGAIQFTGAGGNPSGGVIEFSAIGITDWTSNCNVVIDREARTACDAPAIEIRIRQLVNGQYVYGTPFVFNIRQACPVQGCGNTPPTNQSPVLTGTPITSPQTATVGIGYSTTTAAAFTDPDGGMLTYSAGPLPNGVTINPTTGVISGTPTTANGSPFTVVVTATDQQNASVTATYVLNVVPGGGSPVCGSSNLDGSPLRATMPVYDCATITTTGDIQFTGAGGSATGGPIEFKSIGITDWTTNCRAIVDRETRTFCDASPIEIQIRQLVNGEYVYGTSFIFNIRQACPIAGCNVPEPNRAPMVNAGIPDQVATVGKLFDFDMPRNAFMDPDGDELLYTSSQLPESLTFSSGHFNGYLPTAGTLQITITAYDNHGGSASTTFRIVVSPAENTTPTTPPTTPGPTACGSSNLDGSTLRATQPVFDCAQIATTGAIQFTSTGGNASGGVIEYKAVGVTDWTSNCQVTIDRETRTACDAPAIEIQIRQLVNGQYVYGTPFSFNLRQACPIQGCSGARVAAPTVVEVPLDVRVLGNPTTADEVAVEIRGGEGKALHVMMVNAQGALISEHTIEKAATVEQQTVRLGRTSGVYLLKVSIPGQSQTVKVIKQ